MFSAESSLASIDCNGFEYKNVLNTKMLWKYKNALNIQKCFGYIKFKRL